MSASDSWAMCPTLGVRDVRAAVDHFERYFGFEVVNVFEPSRDEGVVYGIVRRSGAEVHLQIRRRPLWAAAREGIESDVYVRVSDVDRLHEELLGRGAEVLRAPQDEPYGMRDFTASGPEGLRLTFGAPL